MNFHCLRVISFSNKDANRNKNIKQVPNNDKEDYLSNCETNSRNIHSIKPKPRVLFNSKRKTSQKNRIFTWDDWRRFVLKNTVYNRAKPRMTITKEKAGKRNKNNLNATNIRNPTIINRRCSSNKKIRGRSSIDHFGFYRKKRQFDPFTFYQSCNQNNPFHSIRKRAAQKRKTHNNNFKSWPLIHQPLKVVMSGQLESANSDTSLMCNNKYHYNLVHFPRGGKSKLCPNTPLGTYRTQLLDKGCKCITPKEDNGLRHKAAHKQKVSDEMPIISDVSALATSHSKSQAIKTSPIRKNSATKTQLNTTFSHCKGRRPKSKSNIHSKRCLCPAPHSYNNASHRKHRNSTRNIVKCMLLGLAILTWTPCILVAGIAWLFTSPFKSKLNKSANNNKCKHSSNSRISFGNLGVVKKKFYSAANILSSLVKSKEQLNPEETILTYPDTGSKCHVKDRGCIIKPDHALYSDLHTFKKFFNNLLCDNGINKPGQYSSRVRQRKTKRSCSKRDPCYSNRRRRSTKKPIQSVGIDKGTQFKTTTKQKVEESSKPHLRSEKVDCTCYVPKAQQTCHSAAPVKKQPVVEKQLDGPRLASMKHNTPQKVDIPNSSRCDKIILTDKKPEQAAKKKCSCQKKVLEKFCQNLDGDKRIICRIGLDETEHGIDKMPPVSNAVKKEFLQEIQKAINACTKCQRQAHKLNHTTTASTNCDISAVKPDIPSTPLPVPENGPVNEDCVPQTLWSPKITSKCQPKVRTTPKSTCKHKHVECKRSHSAINLPHPDPAHMPVRSHSVPRPAERSPKRARLSKSPKRKSSVETDQRKFNPNITGDSKNVKPQSEPKLEISKNIPKYHLSPEDPLPDCCIKPKSTTDVIFKSHHVKEKPTRSPSPKNHKQKKANTNKKKSTSKKLKTEGVKQRETLKKKSCGRKVWTWFRCLYKKTVANIRKCDQETYESMFEGGVKCEDLYVNTLRSKPWLWVHKFSPSFYPYFVKWYYCSTNFCNLVVLSIWVCLWSPFICSCIYCLRFCCNN